MIGVHDLREAPRRRSCQADRDRTRAEIVAADTFDLVHLPPWVSLAVTVVLLVGGIADSLWRTRGETGTETPQGKAVQAG